MIEEIKGLPENMVGFKATGEISESDFTNVVMPKVQQQVDTHEKLNYLLVLDTSLKNFTIGAWMKDALMGLKHLTKWGRTAIVSDVKAIRDFTNVFSIAVPGEFKGFEEKDLSMAIEWVSGKVESADIR